MSEERCGETSAPEYLAYRKLQVYEAAVSEAMQEGEISHKERALLNRLRDSLDVSAADAESLERDLERSTSTDGVQAIPEST